MKQIYNDPKIYSQYASGGVGSVSFSYFMDNYCWKILESNTGITQIFITHEGQEIKRYGLSDEEALQRALEEEDYIEAERLKNKILPPQK